MSAEFFTTQCKPNQISGLPLSRVKILNLLPGVASAINETYDLKVFSWVAGSWGLIGIIREPGVRGPEEKKIHIHSCDWSCLTRDVRRVLKIIFFKFCYLLHTSLTEILIISGWTIDLSIWCADASSPVQEATSKSMHHTWNTVGARVRCWRSQNFLKFIN